MLRPYQKTLLQDTWKALQTERSVVMQLPTGGGKTVIAGALSKVLANKAADRRCIVLYLVHRRELADQVANTLKDVGLGGMIGRIQSGYPESRWRKFQIASVQTIAARLDKMTWLDPLLIVIDEAHHARARTWQMVLECWPRAYRLGMTATPERLDRKGLGTLFNTLTLGPSVTELTRDGYLCPLNIYIPKPSVDLKAIKRSANDYQQKAMAESVSEKVVVDSIDNFMRLASDKRTIHYAASIDHSHSYVEKLRQEGIAAEHVDGATDPRKRMATMRRFRDGVTQVVSNYNILTEGFDSPDCDCVVMGRGTMSVTLYLQMAGRVMRPKPDGRPGMIIDAWGNVVEHGPPDEDRNWSLEDGIVKAEGSKKRSKFRRCAECDGMYKARLPSCPYCGHKPRQKGFAEVDVGLVRFGDEKEEPKPKPVRKGPKHTKKQINARVVATDGDPEKLRALAREYHYHPNIVGRWQEIFAPVWSRRNRELEERQLWTT